MGQASALRYEVLEGWEQRPAWYEHRDVAGVAVDSRGDVDVAEVTWTFAVIRGHAREDCHTFQKFTLKP